MKLGYIGLGKMGLNMTKRLIEKGRKVIAYDKNPEFVRKARKIGAEGAKSLSDLASRLESPRTIWLMVPHNNVDTVIVELSPFLSKDDTIIDGGNSFYADSVRRSKEFEKKGVEFMDVGVSGGPSGALRGACVMVGGKEKIYKKYAKLFKDLAVENGFGYIGESGTGHFAKMVHNGIEYGMMQAIGEGFEVMKKSSFNLDLEKIANLYNRGSVVESRLIGWLSSAYKHFGENLESVSGEISHSGEGLWTVEMAKSFGVKTPVIKEALKFRVESKGNPSYAGQVVSALRYEFGGHEVKKKSK